MSENESSATENEKKSRFSSDAGMLDAALRCAARGWPVFPVPPGTKKSHKSRKLSNGKPWGATTDPAEIRKDFTRWANANIGLPTGSEAGFFVIDVDTPQGHDVDGFASLAMLEAEYGKLPETRTAISPSGSKHFYFLWPPDCVVKNSTSKIGPGIDVRGDGGMVLAPPSVKGKGRYEWVNDGPIVEAPQWLIDRITKDTRKRAHEQRSEAQADPKKIAAALAVIPNDKSVTWAEWNTVGMAVWRATGGSEEGFAAFDAWSGKHSSYNPEDTRERWDSYFKSPPTDVGAGTIFFMANEAMPGWDAEEGVSLDDFVCYMPQSNAYIFKPTREIWPAGSINARIPPVGRTPASAWLAANRPVEQMTWAPGEPLLIGNRLIAEGGWITREGVTVFNLYRPPSIRPGDATKVEPWLAHVKKVYPQDATHIINWLAHRVQRPHEKINHALVLGGSQGIGKDTILEPVRHAVGSWNFAEISPQQVLGRFNGFLKSVVLRVSEARDLGDVNRYQFYEHMKVLAAAPPPALRCDEKHLREHYVPNVCTPIITTNHKTAGLYLPADDRRHYVAWSELKITDFDAGYWQRLYAWYDAGGCKNVAAYLQSLDLSGFDPKAPPPKTAAFWAIVDANRAPENSELADALDLLKRPDAVTLAMIADQCDGTDFAAWLKDRRNARQVPHRLEECGYEALRNRGAADGLWSLNGRRVAIYVKNDLTVSARLEAATRLSREGPPL